MRERGGGGERVRVRRRVEPVQRTWPRWVGLGAAVVLVVAGVLTTLDARAVQTHLDRARAEIEGLQDALVADDLDAATIRAEAAGEAARAARLRVDGPVWAVADRAPWVGDDVAVVVALVDVAVAATDIARATVTDAAPLVSGEIEFLSGPRQVNLALLEELDDTVESLDVPALEQAVANVRAVDPDGLLLEQVVDARAQVLALADRGLDALRVADTALDLVPSLFGADGPRTYLVGLQTNAELRGTGGLMTYFSALDVDDGTLDILPAVREQVLIDRAAAELEQAVADAAARETEPTSRRTTRRPSPRPRPRRPRARSRPTSRRPCSSRVRPNSSPSATTTCCRARTTATSTSTRTCPRSARC